MNIQNFQRVDKASDSLNKGQCLIFASKIPEFS